MYYSCFAVCFFLHITTLHYATVRLLLCGDDVGDDNEMNVEFHKKAQLLVCELYRRRFDCLPLSGMKHLTIFAGILYNSDFHNALI